VPGYTDEEDFPVLRFKSLPIPGRDPWRLGIPKLDSLIKKQLYAIPFDLIHTHCPFTSAELALLLARKKGIPVVSTFHSKYKEDFEKNFGFSPAVRWAMNKIMQVYHQTDFVWVPNKGTAEVLREYGFKGEIDIMINGTDLEAPALSALETYRRKGEELIDCGSDDFVLLFVGQHRWIKNIRLIIESARILSERKRSFILVFVGNGPDEGEMRTEVNRAGLDTRVRFMGRIIDRESMKCFYARTDLFLFPSLYDTASLVMREAGAFSTPSVFVRGSSTSEGIIDGENGFISDNDPFSYAGVLESLMDHPEGIKKAGEGAKRTLYLTWEEVVDQVISKYRELIRDFRKTGSVVR
jgi:glycosyltransferase involved in cell wall biosynthesis